MTAGADKPKLDLTPERVGCPMHGEPFRRRWPVGYPAWVLKLLELVELVEPGAARISIAELEALLDELPLCCRVTPEQLLQAYVASNVGRTRKCTVCSQRRLGTRYAYADSKGTARVFPHLCFRCVVWRLVGGLN